MDLTLLKEAGKHDKEVIKSFEGIKAGKTMKIDLDSGKRKYIDFRN